MKPKKLKYIRNKCISWHEYRYYSNSWSSSWIWPWVWPWNIFYKSRSWSWISSQPSSKSWIISQLSSKSWKK